jgi:hypothetical protein
MTEAGVGLLYAVRQGEIYMVIMDHLWQNQWYRTCSELVV